MQSALGEGDREGNNFCANLEDRDKETEVLGGALLMLDIGADFPLGPTRLQECVYCPSTANLTDEHAPAKLIFPEPRPSDLITVKACLDCNQAGSKDAEYFRVCLCLNPLAKDMPSVVALKPTVQRSLQRPHASACLCGVRPSFMKLGLTPRPRTP